MKTKLNCLSKLIILSLMFASAAFSQNITNTLGTGGLFTIKDASTNFLTLSQSTGEVNILRSLRLENTTSSSIGVIYKGTESFLHNYGSNNIFLGNNSGNFTMTGGENIGMGYASLSLNTTGNGNIALGFLSLASNITGVWNTAVGLQSLASNTTGSFNTAVGLQSMQENTTGSHNTAVGNSSFSGNTTGFDNTTVGWASLGNTTGARNTAMGNVALQSNTTGNDNTALGALALFFNSTGNNNTAIGFNAQVPDGTLSNQVRIGNTLVTYAGVQVAWTITSDSRWKSNILNSNLGLNFISKLRPVLYTRNNDEKQKSEYGFIAQEVEEVLKESGVDNSGMITIDYEGKYELRYNDLLAPMVQAIQELKAENEKLKQNNEKLSSEVESLKLTNDRIVNLEQIVNELTSIKHTSLNGKQVNLTNSK